MHWVEFWLHGGCLLGLLGLLGMLLLIPCAPWVAWVHLGSILGGNGCPEAGFSKSWAQFRVHLRCLLGVMGSNTVCKIDYMFDVFWGGVGAYLAIHRAFTNAT